MHRNNRFSYKWVIAAACFGMIFICDGFAAGYRGLFLTAVANGLGVKRTLVSVSESCRFLAAALVGIFYGTLRARFSARRLTGAGFLILAVSLAVYSCANTVYGFWVAGALMGVGTSFISTTMASSLIHQWFDRNVGSVTGVVFASSGLGSTLGSQIVSPILYGGDPMGFRTAYRITAIVVAAAALVIVPLLREKGRETAVTPMPKTEKIAEATLKKRRGETLCRFVIGACIFLCAASIMGVNSIYSSHMLDVGISAGTAGKAAGILSLALIASKLLTGVFFDRFGLRTVLGICQGATAVAFTMLLLLTESSTVAALIFPAVFAFALPLETIMIPLIVSDVFGTASYNRVLGVYTAVTCAGFTLASPLSNLIFDNFGSYKPAILGYGCIMILVSVVLHITITLKRRNGRNEPN